MVQASNITSEIPSSSSCSTTHLSTSFPLIQSALEDNVSGSPVITSISKPNSSSLSQEPINIHVSVTINPAMVANNNSSSFHSPPGTLADLKRSRSQSRVSGSSNSVTNQPEPEPPVSINPRTQVTNSGKSGSSSGVTMDARTSGSGSRQHRDVTGSSKSMSPGQGPHNARRAALRWWGLLPSLAAVRSFDHHQSPVNNL